MESRRRVVSSLLEAIQEQRELIAREEKTQIMASSRQSDLLSASTKLLDSCAASVTSSFSEADLNQWYSEQTVKLAELQTILNDYRLSTSQFAVCANLKESLPLILEVQSNGTLALYKPLGSAYSLAQEISTPFSQLHRIFRSTLDLSSFKATLQKSSSEDPEKLLNNAMEDEENNADVNNEDTICETKQRALLQKFMIYDIAKLVSGKQPGLVKSSEKIANYAIHLKLKNGNNFTLFCKEADELTEVIGAHLKRHNSVKVKQVAVLQEICSLRQIAFNEEDPKHVELLKRLWSLIFPDIVDICIADERWKWVGFQGKTPATDFRGMGLLSIHALVYAATNKPLQVRSILRSPKEREYPWAASSLSILRLLLQSFGIDDSNHNDKTRLFPSDPRWSTPALNFISIQQDNNILYSPIVHVPSVSCSTHSDSELSVPLSPRIAALSTSYHSQPRLKSNDFFELFCFLMEQLDVKYMMRGANYMDFPKILTELTKEFNAFLAQSPESLNEYQ